MSKNQDITDKQITEIKTICCGAEWIRNCKLDYRCSKCNKDVTFEVVLVALNGGG